MRDSKQPGLRVSLDLNKPNAFLGLLIMISVLLHKPFDTGSYFISVSAGVHWGTQASAVPTLGFQELQGLRPQGVGIAIRANTPRASGGLQM